MQEEKMNRKFETGEKDDIHLKDEIVELKNQIH